MKKKLMILVLAVMMIFASTVSAAEFDFVHKTDSTKNYSFNQYIDSGAAFAYVNANQSDYYFEGEDSNQFELDQVIPAYAANPGNILDILETLTPVDTALRVESVSAINTNGTKVALEGQTVSPGVKFEVVYSEEIKASTANLNSIKLYKGTALAPVIKIEVAGDNKTVTVTPAAMSNTSDYKLSLSKDVQTADGKASVAKDVLFKTSNSTFVSGLTTDVGSSNTSITTNVVPLGDLGAGKTVELQFNNKLDAGSINASTVKFYNTTEDKEVLGTITPVRNTPNTIRFTIPATTGDWKAAAANSTYRIEVNGVIDEFGNTIEDYTKNVVVAPTAPSVTVRKSDGSVFVNNDVLNYRKATTTNDQDVVVPGAKITLTFNVKMDAATINGNNIYVETTAGDKVTGTLSYDEGGKVATWVPDADLAQNAGFKFVATNKIKDQFGQVLAGLTRTFTTTSEEPSQVVSVDPENGTQTAVPVNQVFEVNFKFDNKTWEDTLGKAGRTAPVGAANKNDKTASVHIYNAATGAYVAPVAANYAISQEVDKKNIKVKFKTGVLDKNATYAIKLIGKNDSGDSAKTTIVDDFGNPMANDYLYTFTTEPADTVAPVVTKLVTVTAGGDAFATTAKEIADGAVNVDAAKDVDVIFSKQLGAVTFDNTVVNGNVVLEEFVPATGLWAKTTAAAGSVNNDAVKEQGYITIDDTNLAANKKYKVTIIPTVGANTIKDLAGVNAMEEEYSFTFSTGDGPIVIEPSAAVANTNVDTVAAAASVGDVAVTGTALTGADGDLLAVELSNGEFFFTTASGAVTGGYLATLTDPLPKTVAVGAQIVNLTSVDASFAKYSVAVGTKAPIAIKVEGKAGANLDEATIENAVKLYKDADNSVVPAKITYKLINGDQDALVSINPDADLDGSTFYYIQVDGLKDKLGNEQTTASKTTKLSFKTVAVTNQVVLSDFNITTGQVVNTKATFSFNVANTDLTKAQIEALFSNDVQDDTIPVATGVIDIVEVDAGSATGDKVSATIAYADGTVTVTPTVPLTANSTYKLRIGTVAFGAGAAALDAAKVIEFRTATTQELGQIVSAKQVEAGAAGIAGDLLVLTFDSKIGGVAGTDYPAADGSDFNSFFTITDGAIENTTGTDAVSLSADGKTITVSLLAGPGTYINPTITKIAPKAALKTKDSDPAVATDTTVSVTIIK